MAIRHLETDGRGGQYRGLEEDKDAPTIADPNKMHSAADQRLMLLRPRPTTQTPIPKASLRKGCCVEGAGRAGTTSRERHN